MLNQKIESHEPFWVSLSIHRHRLLYKVYSDVTEKLGGSNKLVKLEDRSIASMSRGKITERAKAENALESWDEPLTTLIYLQVCFTIHASEQSRVVTSEVAAAWFV